MLSKEEREHRNARIKDFLRKNPDVKYVVVEKRFKVSATLVYKLRQEMKREDENSKANGDSGHSRDS